MSGYRSIVVRIVVPDKVVVSHVKRVTDEDIEDQDTHRNRSRPGRHRHEE
jgi:hypothetical protein